MNFLKKLLMLRVVRAPYSNNLKIISYRNASATMKKVVAFASVPAKRQRVFEEEFERMAVLGICETR